MAACADDGSGDGGGASAAGGSTSSGSGGSTSSGSGGSTSSGSGGSSSSSGQGGSIELPPYCQPGCNTTADCDLGSAAYDPDNYSCDQGACIYTGCNSEAECQAVNLTCQDVGGVPVCLIPCSVAADCEIGGGAAYDADNYSCDQGGCIYTGCNSDAECLSMGSYLCRDGGGMDICQPACITTADCDLGAAPYDADNYSCDDGVCHYLGCNSDQECQALGSYVCR